MIPKVIHYCWFGGNPKPEIAVKCYNSWIKYCPDYEIIEWNESNYDILAAPLYVQQAYKAKKWAFVTDYVRLQVVYEHGGIYLDTDVELLRYPDELLQYLAYFGFEGNEYINTGLGFGAEKGAEILWTLMKDYQNIPFILDNGEMDVTPCPKRNTDVFLKLGLKQDGNMQKLENEILILPAEYLCPLDNATRILHKTKKSISIHHFEASWQSKEQREQHEKIAFRRRAKLRIDMVIYFPRWFMRTVLGDQKCEAIKEMLKGKK